jgi:hypothetical protein
VGTFRSRNIVVCLALSGKSIQTPTRGSFSFTVTTLSTPSIPHPVPNPLALSPTLSGELFDHAEINLPISNRVPSHTFVSGQAHAWIFRT